MIDEAQHAEACGPIVNRLVRAMVEKKDHVEVGAVPHDHGINWALRCHVDDIGKVIGSEGSHLRALQLILDLMGQRSGDTWRGTVMPPVGIETVRPRKEKTTDTHSCETDLELLRDVFNCLGVAATVKADGSISEGFRFVVEAENMVSHAKLLDAHAAIYKPNQILRDPLNLLGAVGTLFRSIARVQGARYKLAVPG